MLLDTFGGPRRSHWAESFIVAWTQWTLGPRSDAWSINIRDDFGMYCSGGEL